MALQVTLNRESLVYNYGETIQGQVAVLNQTNQAHAGLRVTVTGSLHLTPGKKDRVEQTFTLLKKTKELLPAGKVMGNTEVDFSLQLIPESGFELYETYHGQTVSVEYVVMADLLRTGLKAPLRTAVDFILERPTKTDPSEAADAEEAFEIGGIGGVSDAKVVGHIKSTTVDMRTPIEGEIEILSAPPIEKVELQVVRKEIITVPELRMESVSEAQCCEVIVGNVERSLPVPIYCLLQKFVVCPSLETSKFKLEFILRFLIKYKDGVAGTREHYHDIPLCLKRIMV